jgi:uncharacterized membrane protein SirB2
MTKQYIYIYIYIALPSFFLYEKNQDKLIKHSFYQLGFVCFRINLYPNSYFFSKKIHK